MAKIEKLTIAYSLGITANLGNFESSPVRLTREETWDVEDLDDYQVDELWESRRKAIKAELDPLVEAEYKEVLGK